MNAGEVGEAVVTLKSWRLSRMKSSGGYIKRCRLRSGRVNEYGESNWKNSGERKAFLPRYSSVH
jgi:hypothetical protein